mgnify:CR=1 FL=1
MKIPPGVNQKQFYKAAKAKGVSIQSRYMGVSVRDEGGRLSWYWRIQKKYIRPLGSSTAIRNPMAFLL